MIASKFLHNEGLTRPQIPSTLGPGRINVQEKTAMWERIPEPIEARAGLVNCFSNRLEVPGGWIVRTICVNASSGGGAYVTHTFIPDALHEWELKPNR